MLDVFLCHSAQNGDAAAQIAARLERCAEARVWMEPLHPGCSVLDAWEGGLSSGAIVLMLDAGAVPMRLIRQEWQPLLDHTTANASPPVACVLTGPCAYPRLLERKNYFRWQNDANFLRALERWTVTLHEPPTGARTFSPARLPWFQERPGEMDVLWRTLVDNGGGLCTLTGSGKSALAQEFTRTASEHFREVLWVPCGDRSDAFLLGDLRTQLGATDPRSIPDLLREHRLLVVFDDVRWPLPLEVSKPGRSSILLTTRSGSAGMGTVVHLEKSANAAPGVVDQDALRLWQALSACYPLAASVPLAGRISDMRGARLTSALQALVDARLADPLDSSRVRVRHAHALEDSGRRRHAEEVLAAFPDYLADLEPALDFACERDWELARRLGRHAADWLRQQHRTAEAVQVLWRVTAAAEKAGDPEAVKHFRWELSWLHEGGDRVRLPVVAPEQLQLSFHL